MARPHVANVLGSVTVKASWSMVAEWTTGLGCIGLAFITTVTKSRVRPWGHDIKFSTC